MLEPELLPVVTWHPYDPNLRWRLGQPVHICFDNNPKPLCENAHSQSSAWIVAPPLKATCKQCLETLDRSSNETKLLI